MERFEKEKNQTYEEAFERLKAIAEFLREKGFDVTDRLITLTNLQRPMAELGFPIVSDGADGIRASYSKNRGLIIWFTNGFEDPENTQRKEVEEFLKNNGW